MTIRWVSGAVYGVVLLAGLYYVFAGLGEWQPWRVFGFVVGIAALFVFDAVERRSRAAWFLLAKLALFFVVVALDESSLSRVLFVLVPFTAYLTFGRTAGLVLGALCLALLVTSFVVWVPGWYRDANYVSDVLMFCLGLVLAVAMADVAVRERRSSARIAELSAEAERTRLARDIHDSLGHHLTAVSIQLEKASAFADRDPAVAKQALADARDSVAHALDDVRTSVSTLRTGQSLVSALTRLDVALEVEGDEPDLGRAAIMTLFRAAQEAITNARRHGQADQVSVAVTFGKADTRLVVRDDGRGFATDTVHTGFGLLGMKERAALVGGSVTVDSEPGSGTRVAVTVPRS
ncbi:sensor histidine kinase [Kibdelosporangium philippinense]|uniref:Oxygen sensor histidine kinase NreB n=1 Tax=Kibdelosporangium philippinense TaxID=211113 RepID=A0ABS8ZKD5_9PSEU|nr:sensor histidine kinase [Kibdelosporangium philippinense]MCE7006252.1 sensor histidine kinase [Kibdelosporangium philippinense]